MDLQIPTFPILFSFFLFIFMVLKTLKKPSHKSSNLPPGPWKYPFIGNLPQLVGGLPHHRLTDLAEKHGPVMRIQLGQIPLVVISSAEAAKECLKTQDVTFADRSAALTSKMSVYDPSHHILFAPYGDHWRQMRKLCTLELLSAKRVQSFRSVRVKEVSNFIRFLHSKAGSPVNLSDAFSALTNSMVAIISIGEICKDQPRILEIVSQMIEAGLTITDVLPSLKFIDYITGEQSRLMKFFQEVDQRIENYITESRARKSAGDCQGETNSLLDVLLDIQDNESFDVPLTNDGIKAIIMEVLGAGTDSSAKIIEWTIVELIRSPKALRKAQEEVRRVFGETGEVDESRFHELKYLKLVLKESMRLHPPGAFVPRECREKTKVDGYDIDAKTMVLINVYAIQRDPKVWDEPEKFWPERFENSPIDFKGAHSELIPFGAGKRVCPGLALGVANLEFILASLLYHCDFKLPDGVATLDVTEGFGTVLRRKDALNLIPIPFIPLPTK